MSSSAEDRYREADELAREMDQEARHRRESRAQELERLKRLHTEEAEEDRLVSQYTRAMRAVRRYQLQQEPAQVRRSLVRFNVVFVLIALVGAVMVWMLLAQLLMSQGVPGWVGHGAGALYTLLFVAALACYARSNWGGGQDKPESGNGLVSDNWAHPEVPRLLAVAAWVLLLLPVPVMVAAAWAGWSDWASLVLLFPALLCGYGAIFASREMPRQSRKIAAARET